MPPKRGAGAKRRHKNKAQPNVKLIIHHQFPGIELVSPVYANRHATCHLPLDQKVDVGSKVQVGFNIDPTQNESIGALMYKLQKKSTNQLNKDAIYSEEEARHIQLVMFWRVNNSSKEFYIYSLLIERDKNQVWDGDRLIELAKYYYLRYTRHESIKDTWLMHNNTVLVTGVNATREESYYKLEMTIYETSVEDNDTRRPRYIDVNR
jgi:hypothetical protein